MATTTDKLLQLAQMYEDKARGLRMAAAELDGQAVEKKQAKGIDRTMEQAIALRATASAEPNGHAPRPHGNRSWSDEQHRKFQLTMRRIRQQKRAQAAAPPKSAKPAKKRYTTEAKHAARVESQRLLAAFDEKEPRTAAGAGLNADETRKIGPLFRHGYLKSKGDGIIRTAKVYAP